MKALPPPPPRPPDLSFLVLDWSLFIAQLFLGIAMACAAYRLIFGPRAQDRILGLDTFYLNAMLLLLTYGIRVTSTIYFEVALIIGLLGFTGTAALSKFLMRGEVIE